MPTQQSLVNRRATMTSQPPASSLAVVASLSRRFYTQAPAAAFFVTSLSLAVAGVCWLLPLFSGAVTSHCGEEGKERRRKC